MLEMVLTLEDMRERLQSSFKNLDIKIGKNNDLVIFNRDEEGTDNWLVHISSDGLLFSSQILAENLVLLANSFRK